MAANLATCLRGRGIRHSSGMNVHVVRQTTHGLPFHSVAGRSNVTHWGPFGAAQTNLHINTVDAGEIQSSSAYLGAS
jgi:hypothetical protein